MKNIKFLLYTFFLSLLIVGCDDAKQADQDPSEIGSTANKPAVTITPSVASGNVTEGTTITYTLTVDRPIEFDIYFKASMVGGTASEADLELGTGKLSKYTNTTTISVVVADDMVPETDETFTIKIEPDGLDSEFWIIPNNTLPEFSYTLKSFVNPDDLMVALAWDYDAAHDIDLFAFSEVDGPWDSAASSDTPEVKNIVWGTDPDGVYFLGFDPYDVEDGVDAFDYSFILGTPDGGVNTISGSFDYANRDTAYTTMDYQGTTVYILVKVVKNGLNFVGTAL